MVGRHGLQFPINENLLVIMLDAHNILGVAVVFQRFLGHNRTELRLGLQSVQPCQRPLLVIPKFQLESDCRHHHRFTASILQGKGNGRIELHRYPQLGFANAPEEW